MATIAFIFAMNCKLFEKITYYTIQNMKTLLLLTTIIIGVVFPIAHTYAYLIKYLLMIMLFFSFLKMEVKKESFHYSHLYILISNIAIPLVSYFLIKPHNLVLAQVAFITSIAPTAIAAPIIMNILNKNIEYTVISILITNFAIASLLPFLIPQILNTSDPITFFDVLVPVSTVFAIPYILSLLIKKFLPKFRNMLVGFNKYVFYILIININLGTSKASNYIQSEMSFTDPLIYQIAILSFIFCAVYFYIGKLIGPKGLSVEGSQSLGQKNNGFTVWVALTFISPLAVVGPVFYILFQNIYISWQLHKSKN